MTAGVLVGERTAPAVLHFRSVPGPCGSPIPPLRALRIDRGLSLKEFADRIPVSVATASRWETGKRRPHSSDLRSIARSLDLGVDVVASWFVEQPPLSTEALRVSNNLTVLRERRRLSRAELARYLGVSVATIAHWECGRRSLPAARLPAMARALRLSTKDLVGVLSAPALPPQRFPPLTLLRHRVRLTQAQVARRLAVSTGTVSAWERGLRPPSWPHMRQLRSLYRCPLSDISHAAGADLYPAVVDRGPDCRLATAIAAGRRWRGTSLRETADELSINWQTLRRWELGHSRPPGHQLRRLEHVLGLRGGALVEASTSSQPPALSTQPPRPLIRK